MAIRPSYETRNKIFENMGNDLRKSLMGLYSFGVDPGAGIRSNSIHTLTKTGDGRVSQNNYNPQIKRIWDYFLNDTRTVLEDYRNRDLLYEDMDWLYYNIALSRRAMHLLADEITQADTNTEIISVEGEDQRMVDYLNELFLKWGVKDHTPPTALDLVQYGNAFLMPVIHNPKTGIEEFVPVDPRDVIDRIEFTPHRVRKIMDDRNGSLSRLQSMPRIKALIDAVMQDEEYSTYFKSYLFGFQIGDWIVPPWRLIHFRNYTSKSPFFPFGIPEFITSLAPMRQYDAGLVLHNTLRAANFPIDVWEIKDNDNMPLQQRLAAAVDFANDLDNLGLHTTTKEGMSAGERIIIPEGKVAFRRESPNISLTRSDELDLLHDDAIISTGMPRAFLDPNSGTFGDSGVALMQQFRPLARRVQPYQGNLMAGWMQAAHIHLTLTKDYTLDEFKVSLHMAFPEAQSNRDLISSQSDLLRLAGEVMDSSTERIFPDGELPEALVKKIYQQFLPYDSDRIDDWIEEINTAKDKALKEGGAEGDDGGGGGFAFESKRMREAKDSKVREGLVKEARQNRKKWNESLRYRMGILAEVGTISAKLRHKRGGGIMEGRHFYSSARRDFSNIKPDLLIELDRNLIQEKFKAKEVKPVITGKDYAYASPKTKTWEGVDISQGV